MILSGFPKSGNTWLGLILSYYYGIPYLDVHDNLREEARFRYTRDAIKLGLESPGGTSSINRSPWTSVIKSHYQLADLAQTPFPWGSQLIKFNQVPILVLREPKDVAVSYYYYNYFHIPILQGYHSGRVAINLRLWVRKAFYFNQFVLKVASQWRDFHRHWNIAHLSVKYEDLVTDTYGTVSTFIQNLDGTLDQAALRLAVDYCQFENLRRIEDLQNRYYSRNQYFFREGSCGGWVKHFSGNIREKFDAEIGQVYRTMGYGH